MRITRRTLALAGLLALPACNPVSTDEEAIAELMRATWDRPEAPLAPSPIVVSGDYAVADWTQGEIGGRALLHRGEHGWRVLLCAGDALRTADGLATVGVPADDAAKLSSALAEAERSVTPARLQAMARFEGVMRNGALNAR